MSRSTDATARSVPSTLYFRLLPPELMSLVTPSIPPEELKAIIDARGEEWREIQVQLLNDAIWKNLLERHFPHRYKKLLSQEIKPEQRHAWYRLFWQLYAEELKLSDRRLSDRDKLIFSLVKLNDIERLKAMRLSFNEIVPIKYWNTDYWATTKMRQELLDYFYQLALEYKPQGWFQPTYNRLAGPPLGLAAYCNQLEVCDKLIAEGADIDKEDASGWTPLYTAAERGHVDIVDKLLAAGADMNKAVKNWGIHETPLFVAAKYGHVDVVDALLKAGADKDNRKDRNRYRRTALWVAAEQGRADVVDALLKAGADKEVPDDNHGMTPLVIAADQGHEPVVKLLLAQGANPFILSTSRDAKPSEVAKTDAIRQLLLDAEKETHKKVDLKVLATRLTKLNGQHDANNMQQAITCLQQAIETGKAPPTLDAYREMLSADKELQTILDRWFPQSLFSKIGKVWSGFFSTAPTPPSVPAVARIDAVESTIASDTTSSGIPEMSLPRKFDRTP